MTTLSDAVASARLSWLCNYTTGDEQWRIKQLHRLYQFLLDARQELVGLGRFTGFPPQGYKTADGSS